MFLKNLGDEFPKKSIQRGKWVWSRGIQDELVPLAPQGAHSHAGPRSSGHASLQVLGPWHQPCGHPALGPRPWLKEGPTFLSSYIHLSTPRIRPNPHWDCTLWWGCLAEHWVDVATWVPRPVTAHLSARCMLTHTPLHAPGPCNSHHRPHLLFCPQAPSPSHCA